MDGCGASVCAEDIDNCYDCLGGPGTDASGQYSWSPSSGNSGECLESCMDAPADAACYKGRSSADPSGYKPDICPSISVCRSKNTCFDCLEDGACAWSAGSCYDSCSEDDVPMDTSCYEGKKYDAADVCPIDQELCVTDDRPRPVRNGQRYRFNLEASDAMCVDSENRRYEWGEFPNVRDFSACAEKCVNGVKEELATGSSFRGYDFDCARSTCRCLYDEGTLDSRNSGRFDRTNRNLPGEGSIAGSTTKKATYCAKLVGAEFLEEFVAEA